MLAVERPIQLCDKRRAHSDHFDMLREVLSLEKEYAVVVARDGKVLIIA